MHKSSSGSKVGRLVWFLSAANELDCRLFCQAGILSGIFGQKLVVCKKKGVHLLRVFTHIGPMMIMVGSSHALLFSVYYYDMCNASVIA